MPRKSLLLLSALLFCSAITLRGRSVSFIITGTVIDSAVGRGCCLCTKPQRLRFTRRHGEGHEGTFHHEGYPYRQGKDRAGDYADRLRLVLPYNPYPQGYLRRPRAHPSHQKCKRSNAITNGPQAAALNPNRPNLTPGTRIRLSWRAASRTLFFRPAGSSLFR